MQPNVIKIVVNGESKEAAPNQSVTALLRSLDVAADRVAIELNHLIVRKRDWEQTEVPNGSQIEIVEFVGGG